MRPHPTPSKIRTEKPAASFPMPMPSLGNSADISRPRLPLPPFVLTRAQIHRSLPQRSLPESKRSLDTGHCRRAHKHDAPRSSGDPFAVAFWPFARLLIDAPFLVGSHRDKWCSASIGQPPDLATPRPRGSPRIQVYERSTGSSGVRPPWPDRRREREQKLDGLLYTAKSPPRSLSPNSVIAEFVREMTSIAPSPLNTPVKPINPSNLVTTKQEACCRRTDQQGLRCTARQGSVPGVR